MMSVILLLSFTVGLSAVLTRYLYRMPHQHWLSCVNHANERSLHVHPTAGSGGLAILSSLAVGLILSHLLLAESLQQIDKLLFYIYLGGFGLATVSFIDDQNHISPLWRLLAHFFVAYLLLFPTDLVNSPFNFPAFNLLLPSGIHQVLSILFVVWMINLYNFMDGMDGFAGGMSVFGFGSLAVAGLLAGQPFFALCAGLIVASNLGFLAFNFPPAKIFMGDVGASTLGYCAAAMILWANQAEILPLWAGLLVFSPFIVDATVTLILRLARKEKIWLAHKSHHYQQLVSQGWSHKKTVLYSYLLMLACGISALIAPNFNILLQWLVIVVWIMLYLLLMYWIRTATK